MANRFLEQVQSPEQIAPKPPKSGNRFLAQAEEIESNRINQPKSEKPDSTLKTIGRYATQIPLGIAEGTNLGMGANILNLLGLGEALDETEIERIKEIAAREGVPFDENKYRQDVQAAFEAFPTVGNIARQAEEATGLPLTPQTKGQHLVRMGSTAGKAVPGTLLQKGTAALTAPAVKEIATQVGVPEPLAELGGYAAAGLAGTSLTTATKPSGLTTRGFERVSKPTKVSPARHTAIVESVEKDFKGIADQLLQKNRTYSAMKEDTLFKEKIGDLFEKVENLASEIPGKIHTEDVRQAFRKRAGGRETKGISPDEFERDFRRQVRSISKSIPYDEMNATQLVDQFRKNNKSLKELFEPGKSAASNRAKREALLEYNRAIEDVITKKYPDTEFKDLFEFTNKRWQEIMDIESIDKFMGDLFNGKIDYAKGKQIFRRDKDHVSKPFKRIMGEEGFKEFGGLMEDLMTTEKAMSYIKKAQDFGMKDFAGTSLAFLIHPHVAGAKLAGQYGKSAYRALLDKPQLTFTWKSAIDNVKKGHFKEAEKQFMQLDKAFKEGQKTSPK